VLQTLNSNGTSQLLFWNSVEGGRKKTCAHTIYKVSLQVNVESLNTHKQARPAMAQILNSISYTKFHLIRQ
jgi:hypothetical protein